MTFFNFKPLLCAVALCAASHPSTAQQVDFGILESVDAAKEPVFSQRLQAFISELPTIARIFTKGDADILEEVHHAKRRISALLETGKASSTEEVRQLSDATGILLVLSRTKGAIRVKGALSAVCIDKQAGLFLTALHPFQEADPSDCALIIGPDGSLSGIARTLLRKTETDAVLITTRLPFPGQVRSVAKPPKTGEPLRICGSCPGAVFFQLGANTARTGIFNWQVFGRSHAKWFDVDRGFPSGLSGGGVFNASGELIGIATRNLSISSHSTGGAMLEMGRAVEAYPLLQELR